MTYLRDPLAIILQYEHSFILHVSSRQAFQDIGKETGWMRRRGHSSGILTAAQPVASPSDPGPNGAICSIMSRGDSGPLTSTSSKALLESRALFGALHRGGTLTYLECRWTGVRMKADPDAEKSGSPCVLLSSPCTVVRWTEQKLFCSQYFSGQSE